MDAGPHPDLHRYLESWHPEPVTSQDDLSPAPVAALSAVLDLPEPAARAGQALPPLWHWLYFPDWPAQRDLGIDGHPADGHFMPPVPDRRRMFAGGRAEFGAPVEIGAAADRTSSLARAVVKQGSTGEMLFVTVRSEIRQHGKLCLTEEQDLMYRSGGGLGHRPGHDARHETGPAPATGPVPATGSVPATGPEPADHPAWQLSLLPDPPLLFRFSALTANAHRIHYDLPYARDAEGYPGLVVHGPLLVLMMLELVRRNGAGRPAASLSYRLRRPVFAGELVHVLGGPETGGRTDLRVATARDQRHAAGTVSFA